MDRVNLECPECSGESSAELEKLDPIEYDGLYCVYCGKFVKWSLTSLSEEDLDNLYDGFNEELSPDFREILNS